MQNINIAKTIARHRKQKGVTQEQLASYLGVTKASVSKWETGQSFPDVTFLPLLAAYFNITIDELLDYSPQMTKEDIQKLYQQLCSAFEVEPFETVFSRCNAIIQKYYSCFPLLLQIIGLYLNHHMLGPTPEQQSAMLADAIALAERIKQESNDFALSTQANQVEALAAFMLKRPYDTIDLLDSGDSIAANNGNALRAIAYQAIGDTEKAREILQINTHQSLLELVGSLTSLLPLYIDHPDRFDIIAQRALTLVQTFEIEALHFNTALVLYVTLAQGYIAQQRYDAALSMLERYVALCLKVEFPVKLGHDQFFDLIGGWISDLALGDTAPRNASFIKAGMIDSLSHPGFQNALGSNPKYQHLLDTLRQAFEP